MERKERINLMPKTLGAQAKVSSCATRPQAHRRIAPDTFDPMTHRSLWNPVLWGGVAMVIPLGASASMTGDAFQAGADTMTARERACCLRTVAVVGGTGTAGVFLALDRAWYAQYERTSFHWFDDGGEWYLMDKTGHAFNAYLLGEWGHAVLSHCGAPRGTARWVGGSIGLALLTGVEVLDGTSSGWGFSNWDMVANITGTGLFIGQDLAWGEQRMRFKLSSHMTDYAAQRPDLLGTSIPERVLKDYNGLTFWLSGNIRSLAKVGGVPAWLNVAVGYGVEGFVSAEPGENEAITGMMPYRQLYLSPDLDLTRIPCRSKLGRTLLFLLNSIKVPAPALEIRSTGRVVGHWLYF